MDTDSSLLAGLARDLDGSFESLVREHQDRIYSIALRMLGDPRDAEEAAQDALVRAYRALSSYDAARIRELRLRPWLATIVLNLCRSTAGRRARRGAPPLSLDRAAPGQSPPALDPSVPAHQAPTAIAERHAASQAWAVRLASLPVPYRAAVVLRHVDGLS